MDGFCEAVRNIVQKISFGKKLTNDEVDILDKEVDEWINKKETEQKEHKKKVIKDNLTHQKESGNLWLDEKNITRKDS